MTEISVAEGGTCLCSAVSVCQHLSHLGDLLFVSLSPYGGLYCSLARGGSQIPGYTHTTIHILDKRSFTQGPMKIESEIFLLSMRHFVFSHESALLRAAFLPSNDLPHSRRDTSHSPAVCLCVCLQESVLSVSTGKESLMEPDTLKKF